MTALVEVETMAWGAAVLCFIINPLSSCLSSENHLLTADDVPS